MKRIHGIHLVCGFVLAGILGAGPALADPVSGGGQAGSGPDFATIQQRIEQRIQDRISKMQERLSCVQNAQDRQGLRSCLPNRGQRRRGGGAQQQGGFGGGPQQGGFSGGPQQGGPQ